MHNSFIHHKIVRELIFCIGGQRPAGGFPPLRWVGGRQEHVAVNLGVDLGAVQAINRGHKKQEDLRPTNHKQLGLARQLSHADCLLPVGHHQHSRGRGPAGLAGKDNGSAIGQRLADGVKGFAAHDQMVAGGQLLEIGQVGWQVPRQAVGFPDGPIGGPGNNSRNEHWSEESDQGQSNVKKSPIFWGLI